jgi:hypothetical protein
MRSGPRAAKLMPQRSELERQRLGRDGKGV